MQINQNYTNKIIILPEFIANQIAAGEVVQRPESVVKELVENSLDAGATEITVIIQDGGKKLISVFDNGQGMSRDDIMLSIRRHATSKVKTQEDLEKILTFGFRGEALASISSVADIEIRSKSQNEEFGWKLISEPLKEPNIEPMNLSQGTQIFVRNLFYNVPARKKFMKSKLTEIRHTSDTLMRFALIHNDKRITFYSDDNLIFDVHPTDWKSRTIQLLGNSFQAGFMDLFYQNELMKVEGFIALPELARPSTSGQFLFVNRRPIEARNLSYAIFSAYDNLLEKNHKPVYLINLTIDPEKIDVNIHPQKNEVKFDNENYVYNTLRKSIVQTLEKYNLTNKLDVENNSIQQPFVRYKDEKGDYLLVNQVTGEVFADKPNVENFPNSNQSQPNRTDYSNFDKGNNSYQNKNFNNYENNKNYQTYSSQQSQSQFSPQAYQNLIKPEISQSFASNENNLTDKTNLFTENNTAKIQQSDELFAQLENAEYWQIFNKYIIVHLRDRILLVDQHNAHERVIFEKKLENVKYHLSKDLLFENSFELNPSEIVVVQEIADEIREVGFQFEIIQPNKSVVKSIPEDIELGKEEYIFKKIIEEYQSKYKVSQIIGREKVIATMSCKAAIKTGEPLSHEKMKHLVIDLFKCQNPYNCPHGRPIVLDLGILNLDRQFGRSS